VSTLAPTELGHPGLGSLGVAFTSLRLRRILPAQPIVLR